MDAAKKSAAEAQTERALADANLQLAVQAFEDIMDNVASRGSPLSLVSEDEASGISEPVDVSPADAGCLNACWSSLNASRNRTRKT